MTWSTQITQLLDIKYPIIQAPMFGVTTPQMVAGASETGALGTLALGDLSYEKCMDAIEATRRLTTQPFAVNIFVNSIPEVSENLRSQYSKVSSFIATLAHQHGLEVVLPRLEEIHLTDYKDQIAAIIASKCKIVSFTFGNLDSQSIALLKENGTVLIGTCTSLAEALLLEASGIDIICVQGLEAGGHRGSFQATVIPQIGGLSLLSQVYDHVNKPLIYAGGIYNARTLLAAQQLGAAGFQVGSLLLKSRESALLDFEKQHLSQVKESDIVLTRSFSGRFTRAITNTFIKTVDGTDYILPYPYQNKLTNALRRAAKAKGNTDFVGIWVGQSIHSYRDGSTGDILQELIREVEEATG
ncbi:NAD(P)H-dependent flavin oxidoreductase [Sphingobacterium prati]|uniref:NAD(P)H-dependent flavin oxidoreductase n=1 Tax=Sphingobacterium prati TaxID=2737006 RepID=UPI0015569BD4|nr:nitronate monooxygenase family protein [Sphingobacterium prati]NPE47074.1 nitronate monooxygenase [Sphingobacterium prati]